MEIPVGADTYSEGLRMVVEIYHNLKTVLRGRGYGTAVGDEGGFAPDLKSNEEAIEVILEAIEKSGYKAGSDVFIAVDAASREMYKDGSDGFWKSDRNRKRASEAGVECWVSL